jgi:type II secretory pathway pseudopilin PulG
LEESTSVSVVSSASGTTVAVNPPKKNTRTAVTTVNKLESAIRKRQIQEREAARNQQRKQQRRRRKQNRRNKVILPQSSRRGSNNVPASIPYAWNLPDTAPQWSILYNVYIPDDPEGTENTLRIVKEQMVQVGLSYANKQPNATLVLYYNSIGQEGVITQEFMNTLCTDNHFQCRHMQHYPTGFEELTLTRVHEYCVDHPHHKVIYMHSKGSFHSQAGTNEPWRYHLTEAALSDMCLRPPDRSCNVCGLQFFPMWAPFIPGNFWAADCSYIRMLVTPHVYRDKMEEVGRLVRKLLTRKQLFATLYNAEQEDKLCQGRYSAECWVGSHPALQPCDVSSTVLTKRWVVEKFVNKTLQKFQFSMAPRSGIHAPWLQMVDAHKKTVMQSTRHRLREFFFLPGNLIKWSIIYNEVPPPSSWAWSFFPDGEFWKEATKYYGSNVYRDVTTESR